MDDDDPMNNDEVEEQRQQPQQRQQSGNDSDGEDAVILMGAVFNEAAQKERRNSIRNILADESLTPLEKRRNIQSLMDGRRRSSSNATAYSSDDNSTGGGNDLSRAAAEASAALSYNSSDNEEDSRAASGDGSDSRYYEYEHAAGGAAEQEKRRKERATSLPGWSDSGFIAPMAAASTGKGRPTDSIWDDPHMISQRMEKSRPLCDHYERNCTIISPCCGLAFGCRICHDDCPVLPMPFAKRLRPPPNMKKPVTSSDSNLSRSKGSSLEAQQQDDSQPPYQCQPVRVHWAAADAPKRKQEKRASLPLGFDDEETHHQIDRFAIAEIICRLCYTRQSSKTNFCMACHAQFGAYHCNICNLWMSDDESPYHCDECGFCRIGGRENFSHCSDCGMCIDALLFDDHNCKAGKYMSNCPVCQEDLFSSRDASHEMPCGHAIHWHCFKELTTYDTRCPVCKKTAETPELMEPTWHAMAMGIALQPVPSELARVVTIMCNDCEKRDVDRRWHFLGVRCLHCLSFNTTIEKTTLMGRDAANYLEELEAMNNRPSENGGDNGPGGVRPMDAS